MNMDNENKLVDLIIVEGNLNIEIKELEETRKLIAKEFDEKQNLITPLSANIVSYEKNTETFILNIMKRLVDVQEQLTLKRQKLETVQKRMEQLRENSIENDKEEIDYTSEGEDYTGDGIEL